MKKDDSVKDEKPIVVSPKKGQKKFQGFPCEVCLKVFQKRQNLSTHRRIHRERKLMCDICSSKFLDKTTLNLHMRTHLGIKKYQCDVCDQRFTTSTHLISHKRTHTNERPYKCDFCTKAFTVSNALVVHRRIHTGERPYQCTLCDKAFMESGKLRVHARSHTGEKPFKCEVCRQEFSQKGNRDNHMKTHSEDDVKIYKCDLCDKKFSSKAYLKTHKKFHTGDKSMVCNICNRGFVTKLELSVHMDYHLGTKKYKCEICDKEMYQQCHLKRHMEMHKSGKIQCLKCKRFFMKKNFDKHDCEVKQRSYTSSKRHTKVKRINALTSDDGVAKMTSDGLLDKAADRRKSVDKNSMMVSFIGDIKQETDDEDDITEENVDDCLEGLFIDYNPKRQQNVDVKKEVLDEIDAPIEEGMGEVDLLAEIPKSVGGKKVFHQLQIQEEIVDQICLEDSRNDILIEHIFTDF